MDSFEKAGKEISDEMFDFIKSSRCELSYVLPFLGGGAYAGGGAGALIGAVIGVGLAIKNCKNSALKDFFSGKAATLPNSEYAKLITKVTESNPDLSRDDVINGIAYVRMEMISRIRRYA